MLALAAAGLFLASFALAIGTIAYMAHVYGDRARAALRLEHVPARTIARIDLSYNRIRAERPHLASNYSVRRLRDLGSHAA